jgi:hypothetical protein
MEYIQLIRINHAVSTASCSIRPEKSLFDELIRNGMLRAWSARQSRINMGDRQCQVKNIGQPSLLAVMHNR